jgi:hypothetical protein
MYRTLCGLDLIPASGALWHAVSVQALPLVKVWSDLHTLFLQLLSDCLPHSPCPGSTVPTRRPGWAA